VSELEKQIITFSANEQRLIKTGGIECYASNIVSYIEAHFDLGANWSGYDSVRAVWSNDNNMTVISTVLDSNGVCVVPFEVLKTKGIVKVNLVGSISASDVLTDRLTTFPCEAVKVTAKAKTDGSETQPITPSQFEQFVAAVISEVEKVTGMTAQAETLPAGSQATARYENGILYLGIPQGIQGERGETGADGNGIASVVYNADYSLTLVFDNGERFTTPPIRGERGPAGQDGRDGTNGRDGADGVTPNLSVGNVTTLEPSEDAYVTRRGTDANPIFDFGIPKGDKGDPGEVTMSQLSALLPTDTASGSIASFPDGTDLFSALSVKAQIEPIQDLHGYDKPWSGGNGKNKITATEYSGSFYNKAVGTDLKGTAGTASYTQVGNTLSVTTTSGWQGVIFATQPLKAGTYHLNATATGSDVRGTAYITDANLIVTSVVGAFASANMNATVTDGERIAVFFGTHTATTVTWTDSQVEEGSAYTSWTPYTNICPISGHTECVTEVCGVNVWDEEWEVGGINTSGQETTTSGYYRSKNYIAVLPNTTYYFKVPTTMSVMFYDSNKDFIEWTTANNATVTTPSNCRYLRFRNTTANTWTPYDNDISINYPSTDTSYHAYDGHTYTTALGRTVYGGTLDVVSGVLTVDWVKHIITGDETSVFSSSLNRLIFINGDLPSPPKADGQIMCNTFESVSSTTTPPEGCVTIYSTNGNVIFRLPSSITTKEDAINYLVSNGTHIVYPLATPQTYQLDPQTIDLLLGDNNLWTDCGSVEVAYKADIGLYIDKKLSSNGTRSLSMGLTKSATAEAETETEPSKTEAETKAEETKTEEVKAEPSKTETDNTETETR
jgi:hypothetical protein